MPPASSNKQVDLLVYGATGFTGKEVVRYLHSKQFPGLTWAAAGRNESKLHGVLREVGVEADSVPVLIADTSDHDSLVSAFCQAKVVLNCTGPYRFLGESVVKACLDASVHYMDISGEPQFMENMFLKYHKEAQENNNPGDPRLAFDSVPADMGVRFCMQQFQNAHPDDGYSLSSIESFLKVITGPSGLGGHYTTFECAVHGIGDVDSLRRIRNEVQEKYNPPKITHNGPRLAKRPALSWDEEAGQYVIPFMGADASVIRSSFRALSMRDAPAESRVWPQIACYAEVGNSWGGMLATGLVGGVFSTLAASSYGRSLLLAYPGFFSNGIFSHEGPTQQQLRETSFEFDFRLTGHREGGEDATSMRVKVSGPEPGYVATPMIFIALARCLLKEYDCSGQGAGSQKSPLPRGGVLTPQAVFAASPNIFELLNDAELMFEVME
eukprot:CAMPEP_0114457414 /NCGR_PEP_ID=MMETSP0104-20121206/4150_1 /TAXON_ID=37642 ORGANISM="Paraphysomonas imperforata, Strain PA2" /NCGR_SAMPLE_ID=MMETSP0104 /ASSEMBLY_ACC=CAM_ASM_000202 /LENGTH=438 /DNA_ID=CAMNT_0001629959 /DNA_START=23 /DNA_END=1340 /DNA_ORIENTATION=+